MKIEFGRSLISYSVDSGIGVLMERDKMNYPHFAIERMYEVKRYGITGGLWFFGFIYRVSVLDANEQARETNLP